jgi:hypothetical protein
MAHRAISLLRSNSVAGLPWRQEIRSSAADSGRADGA